MKRLQAELREGEARLETAIGGSDIGLWDWTAGTDAIRWLSDWPARRGVKNLSELSNLSESLASIHPNDRKSLHADIRATLSGGLNRFEADYRILTLPDKWRWVHVRAKVLARDLSGRAQRIVGACVDVDTRRRQEDALRSQVAILETMREGVVVLDESGQMEFTNRAFDRMFGCPTGALVGSSIYGLLSSADPSKDLPRRLDRLLRQPGPHMEIFQRKDLTEFNGEVVTTAFDLEMGARWLLVVQDITDRRRLEQEVLDIANRERRQIGYELHDGLCQELTGVTLMLRSIATRVQRGFAPTEPQIQEAISLISTAIDNARSMARGLLPVASDRGLAPALRALTDRAKKSYGMDVRMRSIVSNELRIDNAVASQLYRIAQEAISNAVRHGGAQTVNVILRASDESIALVVSDNGSGMPSGARDGAGMGLKIMEYRARMIGGSVEVAPRRSGGTRVHCTCPAAPPMVAAQSRIF